MLPQNKARIFLSSARIDAGNARWRNRYSFPGRRGDAPLQGLIALNDTTLEEGRSMDVTADRDALLILLPVAGAIGYRKHAPGEKLLAAGQAQYLALAKGERIFFRNPFEGLAVNFLQIWIEAAGFAGATEGPPLSFDVNETPDQLQLIVPRGLAYRHAPVSLSIGKFRERGEVVFMPRDPAAGAFVFVIEGAFEVAGRLLNERDGLALWDLPSIGIEAFTRDALLLVLETEG